MKLVLNMNPHNTTVRLQRDYSNAKFCLLHQENPTAAVLDKLTAGRKANFELAVFCRVVGQVVPGAFLRFQQKIQFRS